MGAEATTSCPNCHRLQEQLAAVLERLAQVEAKLAAAQKNSTTSSKPPSSDIVKPPKPELPPGQEQRQSGGQPGHPKHERSLVPPEQLTSPPRDYIPDLCPDCGLGLQPAGDDIRVVQQIEIAAVPILIEEHRSHPGWCPHCCKVHYGVLPLLVERGGLAGPRLTTLIAFLKGVCHASFATVRKFLRDVVLITLSRGFLMKIIKKVTAALDQPYEELLNALPLQKVLNVDETGHKMKKERWWTWCFRASLYTLFKIDPTRSGDVLIAVLGKEFEGVIGCDHFSAYRRYHREFGVLLQFCLAHLIRDVKFLLTLPDKRDQAYGGKLRDALRELFHIIHKKEEMSAEHFQLRLEEARRAVLRAGTQDVPPGRHSQNLKKRLEKYGESYFRFITTPGLGPTNNLAEQAIRFVVIDRLITQGTRSTAGNRWCERIWTVIATCAQQGRSVFEYLSAAVEAYFHDEEAPALMPEHC
jgi:transposase